VERGVDLEVELRLSFSEAAHGGVHEVAITPDTPCAKCDGTGWRVGGRACSSCEGGVIPGIGPVRVQVPPGLRNGQVLRVDGGGKAGRGKGADRGDLHIRVRVPPVYARFADGVHVEVPCPRDVLRDGGVVEVPLELGGALKVRVKPGTKVGQKLRLRGKGGAGADLIAVLTDGDPEPIPVRAAAVRVD
jgi:molecular chaperone DnaJ